MRRFSTLTDRLKYLAGTVVNFQDRVVSRAEMKDYAETLAAPTIATNVLTLDLTTGNHFKVALDADVTTFTLSNPPATGRVGAFTLELVANGSAHPVTWGSKVHWPAAVAPTLTTTNNKSDLFLFRTIDGGTIWYAFTIGQNVAAT